MGSATERRERGGYYRENIEWQRFRGGVYNSNSGDSLLQEFRI